MLLKIMLWCRFCLSDTVLNIVHDVLNGKHAELADAVSSEQQLPQQQLVNGTPADAALNASAGSNASEPTDVDDVMQPCTPDATT